MALPAPSILSEIALQLGRDVNTSLSGRPKVRIGPPSEVETGTALADHLVNLFLYRFEPSGFHPEASVGDPLYMRIHCLVTAYGMQETETTGPNTETIIGAGEVDLRLLGGIVQHFHENPVRDIVFRRTNPVTTTDEEIRTSLQIVLNPLSSEEISHIWSTQGSTAYRASLAYELALAPVTPWTTRIPAPRVDSARLEIIPPPVAAADTGVTAASGGELHRVSDAEMQKIAQGKLTPPELAPALSWVGTVPPHLRIVHIWPNGGGTDTDAASIDMIYKPHAGLGGHMLHVYRRDGQDWRETETRAIVVPVAGQVTIPFAVVKEPGEWLFLVAATDGAADIPPSYRSAAISLEVRALAQAPGGGGP